MYVDILIKKPKEHGPNYTSVRIYLENATNKTKKCLGMIEGSILDKQNIYQLERHISKNPDLILRHNQLRNYVLSGSIIYNGGVYYSNMIVKRMNIIDDNIPLIKRPKILSATSYKFKSNMYWCKKFINGPTSMHTID
ncbi:hypothetical protein I4U23_013318 [Adineta vaga]|nr:hypothetical protein I4U23_013318 [Adineta vaga]